MECNTTECNVMYLTCGPLVWIARCISVTQSYPSRPFSMPEDGKDEEKSNGEDEKVRSAGVGNVSVNLGNHGRHGLNATEFPLQQGHELDLKRSETQALHMFRHLW